MDLRVSCINSRCGTELRSRVRKPLRYRSTAQNLVGSPSHSTHLFQRVNLGSCPTHGESVCCWWWCYVVSVFLFQPLLILVAVVVFLSGQGWDTLRTDRRRDSYVTPKRARGIGDYHTAYSGGKARHLVSLDRCGEDSSTGM